MMKNNKLLGFIFLLGALTGVGLTLIFRPLDQPPADTPGTESQVEATEESGALLARIREQEQEIVRLRGELATVGAQEISASIVEPEPEPEAEPERRSGFARQMENRMARRVDSLVADYDLNEAQRGQLEEVFRMQLENFRARRNGEAVEPFNLDEAIAGVLSEEQFAQYLEESQEEIYNRAELIATTQLVRLIQSVELSDEQQATVYDTVNATAQEWLIARQTGEDFNMREAVQEQLGTILTEEQLSSYLESLGNGSGFGPPGGGRPPGP
ncbi:hypothetical protein G0Q06_05300 [Puniceicoccales bacterium CK1056]|uniref:Uncharacterized protein n=1 Tax=Oceanipulchritudo coccoides TaxID=2706888 RepID=A0A6B2M2A8_9BACT|nr:hypothetical protein [Oceanipulchritudo coccoides]NDV61860.1 hypothetical protein [Oceanipulchritudo coccoides]